MKKFLAIIGVAALLATALTPTAQAQTPSYSNGTILTSATYAAGVTNLASPVSFFVGDRQNVAIQMTTGSSAAVTNIFYFAPSVDGISYDTNATSLLSTTNTLGGSGTVTKVQNLSVQGNGFLELLSVNQGVATSTNTVKRSIKISAP